MNSNPCQLGGVLCVFTKDEGALASSYFSVAVDAVHLEISIFIQQLRKQFIALKYFSPPYIFQCNLLFILV
jgi:hypothetical protein